MTDDASARAANHTEYEPDKMKRLAVRAGVVEWGEVIQPIST